MELAQKVSEVEQSQVEWFIQAWATPFLGPQCFRQKKHGHSVFLMRSVQDQTRAQEEGVTITGSCGQQGPCAKGRGPRQHFVCSVGNGLKQAAGPWPHAAFEDHEPHCGDSFQCSQQSDPESPDLLKLAGKLKFREQSLGKESRKAGNGKKQGQPQ